MGPIPGPSSGPSHNTGNTRRSMKFREGRRSANAFYFSRIVAIKGGWRMPANAYLAEGVGFEPTVEFPPRRFSRPLP